MAFPSSPKSNQLATVNGITYIYNQTKDTWTKYGSTSANIITTDTANVTSTTTSTSTVTGALRVAGGVGVAGNVYAGNFFYANGASILSVSGVTSFVTSNVAPTTSSVGSFWFNTNNDTIYQYINTGFATYWIDVSGQNYNFGVSLATQNDIIVSGASPSLVEYVVAAGGGSGGSIGSLVGAGGGGAGGLFVGSSSSFTKGFTYTVTIGAGGATSSVSGGNSSVTGYGISTAVVGGGFGGSSPNGGNGGSGGGMSGSVGGSAGKGVYPGSSYISATRQGYDGGIGFGTYGSTQCSGGGGGGSAGAGGNGASISVAGEGGTGTSNSYSGTAVTYSIGGTGGKNSGGDGVAGTVNTGNGGGGACGDSLTSGAGGSGVVVLRYPDTFTSASTTGSPTFTQAGGYKIYKFTSSGTITF